MTDLVVEDIGAVDDHLVKLAAFDLGAADVEMLPYKLLLRLSQSQLLRIWHARSPPPPAEGRTLLLQ